MRAGFGTARLILLLPVGLALAARVVTSAGTPHPDFNGDGFDDLAIGVPGEDLGSNQNAGAVHVIYGVSSGLAPSGDQFWRQDADGVLDEAEDNERFGSALTWGDFNGDGFSDLAIGAPHENVGDLFRAGAVHVLYGSTDRLSAEDDQLWHQNVIGVVDSAETDDEYGHSLASGDFNGDGFSDLAIGVLSEDIGDSHPNCGAVHVLYGGESGLSSFADELWHQDSGGIEDQVEPFDLFGWALAIGDFDGDGFDDLAIGVQGEDVGLINNAGAVSVIYGSQTGLTPSGDDFWHQNRSGVADSAEFDDRFGFSLAAGDFDGDGRDDLAIGAPFEDFDSIADAGSTNILYGTATGLSSANDQLFTADTNGISTEPHSLMRFARSLAAADFDGDGRDDLVIGVPEQAFGVDLFFIDVIGAGAIHVVYGSDDGLDPQQEQFWHQDVAGVQGNVETGDRFGATLKTADFNADGRADLAIGVPDENIDGITDMGVVQVLFGSGSGLTGAGDELWHQNSPGIANGAEALDHFGGG